MKTRVGTLRPATKVSAAASQFDNCLPTSRSTISRPCLAPHQSSGGQSASLEMPLGPVPCQFG